MLPWRSNHAVQGPTVSPEDHAVVGYEPDAPVPEWPERIWIEGRQYPASPDNVEVPIWP